MNSKARSRIGMLFSKLKVEDLPLHLAVKIFKIYILPIYLYGLPIWASNTSESARESINVIFLKYLKRYLGLPKYANNAITYHITGTEPLSNYLLSKAKESIGMINVPTEFSGYQIQFIKKIPEIKKTNLNENIPTWFWMSRMLQNIPQSYRSRRIIMKEIYDLDHMSYCQTTKFHANIDHNQCKCILCNQLMSHYHYKFCPAQVTQ